MKRLATGLVLVLALQACATGEDPDAAFKLVPVGDGAFLLASAPPGEAPDPERMVNGMIGAEAHCKKTNQSYDLVFAQADHNGEKREEIWFKCIPSDVGEEK